MKFGINTTVVTMKNGKFNATLVGQVSLLPMLLLVYIYRLFKFVVGVVAPGARAQIV